MTASIPMTTQIDEAKLYSDIMAESDAKEASVNKLTEKQAVKGDALASNSVSVSLQKITTSQSLVSFYYLQKYSNVFSLLLSHEIVKYIFKISSFFKLVTYNS